MDRRRRLLTLLALACSLAPDAALAQYAPAPPPPSFASPKPRGRTEVTAIAGYQLNSDIGTSAGNVSVGDAPVYGAEVAVETLPGAWAQLLWLYSEPRVSFSAVPSLAGSSFDVATHYFQIGGLKGIRRDRATLYGGATIGAALFLPGTLRSTSGTNIALSDTWRFAFTLGGGLKVDLSEHVGLRFDLRVAAPVYFSSGAIYAGSGGAGVTVSGGIPLWQWNFLGGIVLSP